ncbi:CvpA family protein [Thiobacter aerophilum]|uniref:CvpA family protein n=1 Tax=Thiobacter aerophilum TaxID=3121275 RepID=A0ABV0EG69_9BURK
MTWFDYAVLFIVGTSMLLSVMRGFLREVMALLSWVVAFWMASLYAGEVAPLLPSTIPSGQLRMLAAWLLVFFAALFMMTVLSITVGQFLKLLGVGPLDRLLGALFGFARGMVIVLALMVVAGLTSLPRHPEWRNATFSAPLEALVTLLRPWLPEAIGREIKYE